MVDNGKTSAGVDQLSIGNRSAFHWTRRRWLFTSLVSMAAVRASGADAGTIEVANGRSPLVFAPEFFGMHIHRSLEPGHWPSIGFGAWRLWDTRTNWANLEPVADQWQFDTLDRLIEQGTRAGVRLMIVLGITPRWASSRPDEHCAYGLGGAAPPRDIERWRSYVRRVAKRYAGKVHEYEVLNEANLPGYWSGTLAELAALVSTAAEEIRAVDPAATIVAPSGVGLDARVAWIRDELAAGIGHSVEALSFHLYHGSGTPETIVAPALQMQAFKRAAGAADKPIWNTETGYWIKPATPQEGEFDDEGRRNVLSAEVAALRVPRAMLLARGLGFERFYWYAWDNLTMGFIEPGTNALRAHAKVLGAFIERFRGASLGRLSRSAAGLWVAELTMASGEPAQAFWTEAAGTDLTLPADSRGVARVMRFTESGVDDSVLTSQTALRAGPAVTVAIYGKKG